jgi:outer membrane protein OmpA-like peptidoglycan-associated protein
MRRISAFLGALAWVAGFPAEAAPGAISRLALGEDGMPGVQGTFSAFSLSPGECVVGFSVEGHTSESVLAPYLPSGGAGGGLQEALFLTARPHLALGLFPGWDGSLQWPYFYETFSGEDIPFTRARGQGDLTLALKGVLPWSFAGLTLALRASGTVPLAAGEGAYPRDLAFHPPEDRFPSAATWPYGSVDPRLGLGLGTTWSHTLSTGPLRLHGNLVFERPLAPPDMEALGLVRTSVALETALGARFRLQASVERAEIITDPVDWSAEIGEGVGFLAGAGWIPVEWLAIRAGMRIGPADLNPPIPFRNGDRIWRYRANPPAAGFLAFSLQGFPLSWDRDGDGRPDGRDRCPRRAEDKDGFEDNDGCPDLDNDRDGYLDSLDRCPNAVEDRDGFRDWDGCPDLDNDKDGVEDLRDACTNEAEDRDGLEDEDGCPDLDDDRDGLPDAADKCPKAAETRNGFEDQDGCPEQDADKDALPDKLDRCPYEAEIVNFYQDQDGCPDQKPEPVRSGVLRGVAFLRASAELLPVSYPALDSLAGLLAAYPGTEIEIEGHLDDRSGSGAHMLSMERAKAVAEYLASKGVEARRLKPSGYGSSRPVATNRTAAGREANRRIEIRRLN